MAVLAIKTSAFRNAVSCLHRLVSQEMWQGLWPKLPVWEVPITSVTNGIHLPTWLNGDLAQLYDQYLQPDWRERYPDPKIWDLVQDIPSRELWEAHRRRKRNLIAFVREQVAASAIHRKAPAAEHGGWPKCWIPTHSPSGLRGALPLTSARHCYFAISPG